MLFRDIYNELDRINMLGSIVKYTCNERCGSLSIQQIENTILQKFVIFGTISIM